MVKSSAPVQRESVAETPDVRQRILDTASALFYERGVRAVGVDLVVDASGVAKTSLYRHFRTKDDLIVAFLEREDVEFWAQWDDVSARHVDDATAEIEAHMRWIGKRLARANYRGCPQINVAAEFAEAEHPARAVSRAHMQAMRRRLTELARSSARRTAGRARGAAGRAGQRRFRQRIDADAGRGDARFAGIGSGIDRGGVETLRHPR